MSYKAAIADAALSSFIFEQTWMILIVSFCLFLLLLFSSVFHEISYQKRLAGHKRDYDYLNSNPYRKINV